MLVQEQVGRDDRARRMPVWVCGLQRKWTSRERLAGSRRGGVCVCEGVASKRDGLDHVGSG